MYIEIFICDPKIFFGYIRGFISVFDPIKSFEFCAEINGYMTLKMSLQMYTSKRHQMYSFNQVTF